MIMQRRREQEQIFIKDDTKIYKAVFYHENWAEIVLTKKGNEMNGV